VDAVAPSRWQGTQASALPTATGPWRDLCVNLDVFVAPEKRKRKADPAQVDLEEPIAKEIAK
jgi:hypothetical protein